MCEVCWEEKENSCKPWCRVPLDAPATISGVSQNFPSAIMAVWHRRHGVPSGNFLRKWRLLKVLALPSVPGNTGWTSDPCILISALVANHGKQ